ncbi:hypothetical protein ACLESD_24795 [Pyxidicoccus sp. 3LFB2]
MLGDFVNPWQWARRGAWGVALGLGLGAACVPPRDNECAAVQSRVLAEVRVVDGFHDHFHDAESITRHTRRLREVSAGLRTLDIRDAGLRLAVQRYHTSIDQLAEAWAQVAEARRGELSDAGADAGGPADRLEGLSTLMSARATVVNGARSAISEACGAR